MSENKKKANPIISYFKDVKGEMKKVAWPTFKQVKNNTVIVIICVVIVCLFITVLDFAFGKGFELLINRPEQTEQVETENDNIVIDDAEIDGEGVQINPEAEGNTEAEADAEAGEEDAE